MKVTAYKTHKIAPGEPLFGILDTYLPTVKEADIVAVTSKIVSLFQRRVVKKSTQTDKHALIKDEADLFINQKDSPFDVVLTVKDGIMIANSGIDESNGDDQYVLWPNKPFDVAAEIWKYLGKKHSLKKLGVMITDTRLTPQRWGTIGIALSWCGFEPLKNYIGEPDIFGHKLRMTNASIVDGLAAGVDLVIGQGNEQTPLAIVSDVAFVQFLDRPPSKEEIAALRISLEDDLYAPILTAAKWKKTG